VPGVNMVEEKFFENITKPPDISAKLNVLAILCISHVVHTDLLNKRSSP
jgi:hypothetical protein